MRPGGGNRVGEVVGVPVALIAVIDPGLRVLMNKEGRRAALYPSVPAGLVRLPQPARPARQLLHQLHSRHPGAPTLVLGAGAEISLD